MSLAPLWSEGWVIASHALAALAAFGLALWQLAGPKGGLRHRVVGRIWVGLMVFVAAGSFWVNELRLIGPFSPIHLLSALTLITLPLAVIDARRGRIEAHKRAMQSFFWLALVLTGLFTLMPGRAMHAVLFGA